MVPCSHTVHKVCSRFAQSSTRFKSVCATSIPSIARWCEVDYRYDRFPTVSLFGFAISNIAHWFKTWIYSILLPRTMNNFAALNMLIIGFIQLALEEEREYNDLVEQQRRRGHVDWRYPWCTSCFQVFDILMCTVWSGEQEWERIGYLYKSGQNVMIVTFCTY